MEDKKDFDKDKQEMGTQQMPHVPADGEEVGKKSTIVLFDHEFDKRKAVLAGLGGLLAIALIGGGVWYAASQKPEPKEPTPIEQTEKQEQQVIQLGAKADGWVKGESSPVIAHIVNKEEKVDYYHAYDANEPHALDVPAEGEYEVSFISPVDKDGSIYEVPKTAKVKPETGGNSTSSGNGGSTGSNGGSGSSNNGGGSKPQHTHNWVPQTTVVHHDAQYQTIHHDAVYGTRVTCNQCHADLTNQDVFAHFEESFLNGGSCESYSTVDYQISPAWDEQVLVSDAWDETVTTGYKCSGCPATK